MSEPRFTDEDVDAALDALGEPGRFSEAEQRVVRMAPRLQRVLAAALHEGGWFGEAHESQLRSAASVDDEPGRVSAIRTLLAEETRMGMLVGVAVGWELARELGEAAQPAEPTACRKTGEAAQPAEPTACRKTGEAAQPAEPAARRTPEIDDRED